jgi:surface protein
MYDMPYEEFESLFECTYSEDYVQITRVKDRYATDIVIPSYIEGYQVCLPDNCSSLFSGCRRLVNLDLSDLIDTSNVTNMSFMFASCIHLESVDFGYFDASNIIDISGMFMDCENLMSIDLSNFEFLNKFNGNEIFSGDCNLTTIVIDESFLQNICTHFSRLFNGCDSLVNINVCSGYGL